MVDYVDYLINQLKKFVANDNVLSKIIPKNVNPNNGKEEYNIKPNYIPTNIEDNEYPLIIIKTLQNNANNFNISNYETATAISWQIDIASMVVQYDDIVFTPEEACKIIRNKIRYFMEKVLKLNRITVTDAIPIETSNQVYALYLRYNAIHDLLNNKIKRR